MVQTTSPSSSNNLILTNEVDKKHIDKERSQTQADLNHIYYLKKKKKKKQGEG